MIFLPSPLPSPDGTLSQSEPRPLRCFGEGPGSRGRAVLEAAARATEDTCEPEGLMHASNCCLNGLEGAGLQVMADMLLLGGLSRDRLETMAHSLSGC